MDIRPFRPAPAPSVVDYFWLVSLKDLGHSPKLTGGAPFFFCAHLDVKNESGREHVLQVCVLAIRRRDVKELEQNQRIKMTEIELWFYFHRTFVP